jgi:hypothetical protein
MKCEICDAEVKEGKLGKLRGTYIMKGKKKIPVCNNCQKAGEGTIKEKLGGKL